jgi:hypothetical protein
MMKIRYLLLETALSTVHPLVFFASAPAKAVQAQQITILGLHYVLLGIVVIEITQFHKVRRLCDWG